MDDHKRQQSDAEVIEELLAIHEALVGLARDAPSGQIAAELTAIRAELHQLAADNAELGGRLAASLDLHPADANPVSDK